MYIIYIYIKKNISVTYRHDTRGLDSDPFLPTRYFNRAEIKPGTCKHSDARIKPCAVGFANFPDVSGQFLLSYHFPLGVL